MKVVPVSLAPPVGPACAPTTSTSSQGIAPGVTNFGFEEVPITLPQTELVSWECCQVARTTSPSKGLGLKKCVVTCSLRSLNNVACGVNSEKATPEAQPDVLGSQGRQT